MNYFFSSFVPNLNALQAGQKTSYRNLIEFTRKYQPVTLILILRKDKLSEDIYKNLRGIVDKVEVYKVNRFNNLINFIFPFLLFIPPRFATRINLLLIFKILTGKYKNSNNYWFEFSQTFFYSIFFNKNKVTLSAHDLIFNLLSKKTFLEKFLFKNMTLKYEKFIFSRSNQIIIQSAFERNLIINYMNIKPKVIKIINPVLSDFVINFKPNKKVKEKYSIIFWGAMDRYENEEAIKKFYNLHFNNLIKKYPDFKLYIVGAKPNQYINKLSTKNIVVTGFVKDPTIYFQKSTIGIAPLVSGAGIKVKVLEMLNCSMYVISTPLGRQGIPNKKRLITCDITNFGNEISKIFDRI